MSDCWAIVPVKDLDKAKSRLGRVLGPEERTSLSLEMLERVLAAAGGIEDLSTLVVSRDRRALAQAQKLGATAMPDQWQGLNLSLEEAARWCRERGANCLLVLHADLPLLRGEDIAAIMDLGHSDRSLVLAPCRREEGTNALLMRPPGLIPFAFGPSSFQAHAQLAPQAGATVQIYRSPTIGLDIDTEEDLRLFRSQVPVAGG